VDEMLGENSLKVADGAVNRSLKLACFPFLVMLLLQTVYWLVVTLVPT
jgi:hypothetical protein